MSGGTNNLRPPPGNWPIRRDYAERLPTFHSTSSRTQTFRAIPDTSEAAQIPWWVSEERMITELLGPSRFPMQYQPRVRVVVLDNGMARELSPSPGPFLDNSPPRITGQWNTNNLSQDDDSRLTPEEQKKALEKLKKEVYTPTLKSLSKRLSLYYRDRARNDYTGKGNEVDDDGKRCAICLDDFEPREEVILTPCNHMFHEDCILPWVKSHGQCPVCRFALCERTRDRALPLNNNNAAANMAATELLTGEFFSLLRA